MEAHEQVGSVFGSGVSVIGEHEASSNVAGEGICIVSYLVQVDTRPTGPRKAIVSSFRQAAVELHDRGDDIQSAFSTPSPSQPGDLLWISVN